MRRHFWGAGVLGAFALLILVLTACGVLIEKGTEGDVVRSKNLYKRSLIAKNNVARGAIHDPRTLTGKAALTDIYPGQQLTDADFGASTR